MAVGKRVAGALPLAGVTAAAMALTGVAVFAVSNASCADSGQYVQRDDGVVELVGTCLDPADLPSAPTEPKEDRKPAEPASNQLGDRFSP